MFTFERWKNGRLIQTRTGGRPERLQNQAAVPPVETDEVGEPRLMTSRMVADYARLRNEIHVPLSCQ